jgi:hypothetical protein
MGAWTNSQLGWVVEKDFPEKAAQDEDSTLDLIIRSLTGEREKIMKVTFDSNVWEKLVSESQDYPTIREKISSGMISPYLCEISVSLESIEKSARQNFFPKYKPITEITGNTRSDGKIDLIVQTRPNNKIHPGLSPILIVKLLTARDIRFKILTMTNIGTIRSPEIPTDMRATIEGWAGYWEYANRLKL